MSFIHLTCEQYQIDLLSPPPPPLCFAKIVRMIVGEYEQRAFYKRYNVHVVGNGPDSVLETSGATYREYFHLHSSFRRRMNTMFLLRTLVKIQYMGIIHQGEVGSASDRYKNVKFRIFVLSIRLKPH